MSSDNAMHRFKKLLDERGVKYVGNERKVRFSGKDGCECRAYTRPNNLHIDVTVIDATPEQAIAATLRGYENDALKAEKMVSDLEDELARRDAVIEALKAKNERLKSMVQLFGTY